MNKIFILSFLSIFVFADDGYIPVSSFSNNQKSEDNLKTDVQVIKMNSNEEDGYESVKNGLQSESEGEKEVLKKDEIIKEYKKDNILKDTKKENSYSSNKDFTITPKISYIYLKTDISGTNTHTAVDKNSSYIPEIALKYKNHTVKGDFMDSKAYFNSILVGESDLETITKWNKLYYLYGLGNLNLGLAYNKFDVDWRAIKYNSASQNTEEFPSLELHMKNEDDTLVGEYGVSYGKNDNISYAYEYYVNVGYKLLRNNSLIASAGYKNRVLDFKEDIFGYKFQYNGPTLSLTGTF